MPARPTGLLLVTLLCCSDVAVAAASAALTFETSAPAGFEDLTAPQKLVVDIYYGGRQLGAATATIDQGTVRFEDPDALLGLLPDTNNPALLLERLHRPFRRNSNLVCQSRQQRDCGLLFPAEFGLIYDPDRYRADVFFAPQLLPRDAAVDNPYLPASSSRFAVVQNLSGNWSGVRTDNGRDQESVSLYGHSIVSFGESGLHSRWALGDDQRVYTLNWTRDYRGHAYAAGLLQSRSGVSLFGASPFLYGVEYRSSNRSRTDNRYRQGTLLEVNMPVRGRVEVRRDNRLLMSEILEAGNRLLDTSSLPGGAYELEIRTFDEAGRLLAEYSQFFAKDSQLPPPGEWGWNVQVGQPARLIDDEVLPERYNTYYWQAGFARRLWDNLGGTVNLAGTETEQMLELGARWIGEYLEFSPQVLHGDDGREGYRLYGQLLTPWFSVALEQSRLDAEPQGADEEFSMLATGFNQRSASITAPVFGGQLSLRYSERDTGTAYSLPGFVLEDALPGANSLATLEYRRNILRSQSWHGEMRLTHSDADGQSISTASFQFRRRGNHWNYGGRSLLSHDSESGTSLRGGVEASWQDRELWPMEVSQRLALEAGDDESYLASHTRVAGRRGQLNSTLDYRSHGGRGGESQALNYLGNFSTNLVSDGNRLAWGGEQSYESAVLVDINGSAEQQFEILVNGSRRGYATGGGRSLVNLPAFGSYEVQLKPLENGFHDFSDLHETITLYPGNVASAEYRVQNIILALGRITRGQKPVQNARITIGGFTTQTDSHGVFQLEMPTDGKPLPASFVRWRDCRVGLAEQSFGDGWLNLGTIDLETAQCDQH
ncbi:TcfC E-set like domain-containing protein [Microbulbifer sp. M83]|uniref:TcfC E-set like domain-containing protein n=1 Tax=Microbulbifer sp. M83 TaxID=3118246 RepID=UPI002FDF729A